MTLDNGQDLVKRRNQGIYFGWWTVLFSGIWSGLAQGFSGFGISVLFKPIAADLNLSRSVTSVASGLMKFEGGVESLLTGWLSDKFGPRWIIVIGAFLTAIGLLSMYFINSFWSYILVWGVLIAFGNNLAFSVANAKFITNWFVKKRGRALGLRYILTGALGVVLLPIVTWLVATQGWRMTCVIWGVVILCGIPLLWYFVKQKRPEYYGLLPDGVQIETEVGQTRTNMIAKGVEYAATASGEVEFTYRQGLKTPNYWMLTFGYGAGSIMQGAINIHLIPFLTDKGIDATVAGQMMSIMIFFTVIARFLFSFLCDRLTANYWRYLLAGAFFLQALGVVAILLNPSIFMLYVFLVFFGIGSGGNLPRIMMEGRYFGRKAFGSLDGTANMIIAPFGFIAPVFAGWIFDSTRSYEIAFIVLAATTVVGAAVCCFAKPPNPPTVVSGIDKFV